MDNRGFSDLTSDLLSGVGKKFHTIGRLLPQSAVLRRIARRMAEVGRVAYGMGVVSALLLWGLGLWWMILATLITCRYFRSEVPFNLGWWGYTFPLGVFAVTTLRLANVFDSLFFDIAGALLVAVLAMLWLVVAWRTANGAYQGKLFVSPCIASLQRP